MSSSDVNIKPVIDVLVMGAIALAIAVIVNTKVGAVTFIAMMLNIFGIPLLFLDLPHWVIYVIVVVWVSDLYAEYKRMNG